jgi:hypothetical protein
MDRTAGLRHFARRMQLYRHTLVRQQRHGFVLVELGHVERFEHGFRHFLGQQLQLAVVVGQLEFAILFRQLVWRFELWRQRIVVDAVRHRDRRQQCSIGQSGGKHGSQHVRHAAEPDRTLIGIRVLR